MAVTNITPLELCLKMQQGLDTIVGQIPQEVATNGFLKAVTSAENTQGLQDIATNTKDGKTYQASVKFNQPRCNSVTDTATNICTAVTALSNPNKEFTVTVDEYSTTVMTLNKERYRTICDTYDAAFAFELGNAVRALRRDVNDRALTKLTTLTNTYFDGTSSALGGATEKTLKLFSPEFKPNAMGWAAFKREYARKGYQDVAPIVIGGDPIENFKMAQSMFAGNYDKTFDVAKINNISLYADYALDGIPADGYNHFLSWTPGHVRLLEAYNYTGVFEEKRPEGVKTTMVMDGFKFDVAIYDPFCGSGDVTITISKKWDLFTVPSTAVAACSGQRTVLGWVVDCGDMSCLDAQTSPVITP